MSIRDDLTQWMIDRIGRYAYSQGPGRDRPDDTGATDCSALVRYAYLRLTDVDPGTWTGHQITRGRQIPLADAQPGDLIFFDWASNGATPAYDHVEMYLGGDRCIGHGGPGYGPRIRSLSAAVKACRAVMARTYLSSEVQARPIVLPTVSTMAAPAFPLPPGWYFGPASGPRESVSGYYGRGEGLMAWQQRMRDRGWSIAVDGRYGPQTRQIAMAFQREKGLLVDGLIGPATWAAAWTAEVTA